MTTMQERFAGMSKRTKLTLAASVAALGLGGGGYAYLAPHQIKAEAAVVGRHESLEPQVIGSSLVTAKHALLNVGKFPNQVLTIRILPDNPAYSSCPKGRDTMVGKTVTASGTVGTYNGKKQIEVASGDAVSIK